MTNLCIVRVARGVATSTTWARLVLLYRVGTGGRGGQGPGRKVILHVIHVSGASSFAPIFLFFSLSPLDLSSNRNAISLTLSTLKHAHIAVVEWQGQSSSRPELSSDDNSDADSPDNLPPSGGGTKVLGTLEQHRLHGEHLKGHSAIVPERTRRRGQ
jgi:hypothetical protein